MSKQQVGQRPGAAAGRPRRWWLVLAASGIPVVVGMVALFSYANPRLAKAPELDGVRLELPETPVASRQLDRLLRAKPPLNQSLSAVSHEAAIAAIRDGRWPRGDPELRRALDERSTSLDRLRDALVAPGCWPEQRVVDAPNDPSYLPIIRGTRLLVLRALLGVRPDVPEPTARELFSLFDRLLALEQKCAPNLIGAMVLSASLQHVAEAFGFVLAQPSLQRDTEAETWRRLLRFEQRRSPLPDALRWEARWLREVLQQPADFTTVDQAARGEGGAPIIWPYYDPAATIALADRIARRNVWLVEQPLDAPAWARPTPEAEYLARLRRQPQPLIWLRYNGAGTMLLAIAQPNWRTHALKWHRSRCEMAAQRARWIKELQRRGRSPLADASRVPPRDPFTGQTFSGLEDHPICAVPRRLFLGESIDAVNTPLPLPPPLQPSAPPAVTPRGAAVPAP